MRSGRGPLSASCVSRFAGTAAIGGFPPLPSVRGAFQRRSSGVFQAGAASWWRPASFTAAIFPTSTSRCPTRFSLSALRKDHCFTPTPSI